MSFAIGDRVTLTLRPDANSDILNEIRRDLGVISNNEFDANLLRNIGRASHTRPAQHPIIDPVGTITAVLGNDLYRVEFVINNVTKTRTIGAMMLSKATNSSVSGGRRRRRTARRKNRKASPRSASRKNRK
jgi:hypothetical protein